MSLDITCSTVADGLTVIPYVSDEEADADSLGDRAGDDPGHAATLIDVALHGGDPILRLEKPGYAFPSPSVGESWTDS